MSCQFYIECCKNLTCIVDQSTLFSKKLLNSLALPRKFKMNLLLRSSGRIYGVFLLLRNIFKSDQ